MTKPRITVITLCLLFAALSAQNIYACTGRPHSTKMKDIDKFDLWVRATVIDRDDRGYNAILRAEEYYKGEGPLFLAVKRHLPALETITGVLGHRNGCLGDGGGHRYSRGASVYRRAQIQRRRNLYRLACWFGALLCLGWGHSLF